MSGIFTYLITDTTFVITYFPEAVRDNNQDEEELYPTG